MDNNLMKYVISHNEMFDEPSFEDCEQILQDLRPRFGGRSPEEIEAQNRQTYRAALVSMQFGFSTSNVPTMKQGEVRSTDISKYKEEQLKNICEVVPQVAASYAFLYGNYTASRYWINTRKTFTDGGQTYYAFVSFPTLLQTGNHSTLVHVYKHFIANVLNKGVANAFITILDKAGIKVSDDRREYCFPKGHLLLNKKSDIDNCMHDIEIIFREMKKQKDLRDFTDLKFYAKKKVSTIRPSDLLSGLNVPLNYNTPLEDNIGEFEKQYTPSLSSAPERVRRQF